MTISYDSERMDMLSSFRVETTCESLPYQAFQVFDEQTYHKIQDKLSEQLKKQNQEERLICRICNNVITYSKLMIEIDGHHQHTFVNPEGIIFEIGCFSEAKGCLNRGVPTSHFSWFPGYSWRFSFCTSCQVHIGWQYLSDQNNAFFGLILNKLSTESYSC